jgi:hypothetical protein
MENFAKVSPTLLFITKRHASRIGHGKILLFLETRLKGKGGNILLKYNSGQRISREL